MKKVKQSTMKTVFVLLLLLTSLYASAQKAVDKGIGTGNKRGIYLGNPLHFNGLRLTLMSTLDGKNKPSNINGITTGIILGDSIDNGLSTGIIYNEGVQANGIAIGGMGCAYEKVNGATISGMWNVANKVNGVQIGMWDICTDELNGAAIGMVVIGSYDIDSCKLIFNGLGIANEMSTKQLNGVGLTITCLIAKDINGLAVSAYVKSEKQTGVAIALLNKTKKLHGVQFGLLNYAGNNPKALRWLPIINAHLANK